MSVLLVCLSMSNSRKWEHTPPQSRGQWYRNGSEIWKSEVWMRQCRAWVCSALSQPDYLFPRKRSSACPVAETSEPPLSSACRLPQLSPHSICMWFLARALCFLHTFHICTNCDLLEVCWKADRPLLRGTWRMYVGGSEFYPSLWAPPPALKEKQNKQKAKPQNAIRNCKNSERQECLSLLLAGLWPFSGTSLES